MKYYRLKNPITNNYFCRSADQVGEYPLQEAIVYDEETVNEILQNANALGGIYLTDDKSQLTTERFEELQKKFPGYVLEEVNLSEMPLPKEWDIKIEQYAANHDLSYDQAKVEMEKKLIKFWCSWATFNPFDGTPYPTYKNPFVED